MSSKANVTSRKVSREVWNWEKVNEAASSSEESVGTLYQNQQKIYSDLVWNFANAGKFTHDDAPLLVLEQGKIRTHEFGRTNFDSSFAATSKGKGSWISIPKSLRSTVRKSVGVGTSSMESNKGAQPFLESFVGISKKALAADGVMCKLNPRYHRRGCSRAVIPGM